ncbi:aromatic ring-hydroxylating dioxygenase subunit alpha [Paraburkholderia sp. BCC1884]|uniref:aromatic ring-hydroxylating dioxygenase subunit alpha n=1 Tax=Paraburkholderia sp. BCC1884 TaxID=2562668 RepID=UPI0011826E32|nr:aromatic ring-hydroxylating dioxygenase subunit alpha [Paraburkholderia sp. BCC1884]
MHALRNTWYAAAWSSEISATPMRRQILEENIVLFRTSSGQVVALQNMCPHRFAPLHLGKVIDEVIECPYHGLRFNTDGRCVFNPDLDGQTPDAARVRKFPIVEKYGISWIWMGDLDREDAQLIPKLSALEIPDLYRPVTGYLHVRSNYLYMTDNLVDLAHLLVVHPDMLSAPGLSSAKQVVTEENGGISATRFAQGTPPPPIFDMMWRRTRGDYSGLMDHWAESRWDVPTAITQQTGVSLEGDPREGGLETRNIHLVTPETSTTSHYFWAICRNFELDNATLDDEIRAGTEYAFVHQDERLLQALQENMGGREFWAMKPVLLQGDGAAVRIRRRLDKMIREEEAVRAPAVTAN